MKENMASYRIAILLFIAGNFRLDFHQTSWYEVMTYPDCIKPDHIIEKIE